MKITIFTFRKKNDVMLTESKKPKKTNDGNYFNDNDSDEDSTEYLSLLITCKQTTAGGTKVKKKSTLLGTKDFIPIENTLIERVAIPYSLLEQFEKNNTRLEKWFTYYAVISEVKTSLYEVNVVAGVTPLGNNVTETETEDNYSKIPCKYRVIRAIGINQFNPIRIIDFQFFNTLMSTAVTTGTGNSKAKKIKGNLKRKVLTAKRLKSLSDLGDTCGLSVYEEFNRYTDDIELFNNYNAIKRKLGREDDNCSSRATWGKNLEANHYITDPIELLEKHGAITDLRLLEETLTPEGCNILDLLIPTIGEKLFNKFYDIKLKKLIEFSKTNKKFFKNTKDSECFAFFSVFLKSLLQSLPCGSDEKPLHIDYFMWHVLTNLRKKNIPDGISNRMRKNLMKRNDNAGPASGIGKIWFSLSFCYPDGDLIKYASLFLTALIKSECLAAYKITIITRRLQELQIVTPKVPLGQYKICRFHTVDNMKIINKETVAVIKSRVPMGDKKKMRDLLKDHLTSGINYTPSQIRALKKVCDENYIQITGEGGQGKPFFTGGLCKLFSKTDCFILVGTTYCMSAIVLRNKISELIKSTESDNANDKKKSDNDNTPTVIHV